MKIFGTKLGCFLAFNVDGSASRGAHLLLPSGGRIPSNSWSDPFLVTSVSGKQTEKIGIVQCFNDYNYVYAFGHDPSSSYINVSFYGLLTSGSEYRRGGGKGGAMTDVVSAFSQAYKSSRISQSKRQAKLTIGGSSNVFKGFIISMSTDTYNPEYNIQSFSMTLLITECQPS